jgi:hypothetical protein
MSVSRGLSSTQCRLLRYNDSSQSKAFSLAMVQAAMFPRALVLQQIRAHHRRGGQRDDHGDDDRRRERNGELAEQTADDAAHQQQRNKHRHERDADGENGEADLLRTLSAPRQAASCPLSRWREMFSITTMASSTTKPVEMVRAISDRLSRLYPNRYITANVPSSDTGMATPGMSVARALRRKDKHHGDNQSDRNDQRRLNVMDRGADGGGAIENNGDIDAQRNGRLDERELRSYVIDRVNDVGARLAEDDECNRTLAVQIAGGADVLHRVCDLATSDKRMAAPLL